MKKEQLAGRHADRLFPKDKGGTNWLDNYQSFLAGYAAAENAWIRVSERLPDKIEDELCEALICTDDGYITIAYCNLNPYGRDAPIWFDRNYPDIKYKVMAWQPLPSPPTD